MSSPAGIEAASAPGTEAAGINIPSNDSLLDPNQPFLPPIDETSFRAMFPDPNAPATDPWTLANGTPPKGGGTIVDFAKSLLGTPYVWGGTSTSGVDCSGLVYLAYKAAGIDLPRVSYQQANLGKKIKLGSAQAGDLIFWDNSARNNGADHVAISLGGGWIIEAARPGTNVRMRKLGADEGAWAERIGKRH